jgi:uncharacterized membrane protein
MGLSATAEAAKTAIDRLTFFGDAVVAIAMTLLALDLPVPDADSSAALADFVGDHFGEYLAFVISFFVISLYWRGHHRLYRYVTDAPRLVLLNLLWLLAVILTPYATRVLYGGQDISHSDFPWRFTFYAVVQVLSAAAFVLAEREIQQRRLYSESMPPELLERGLTINGVLVVSFLVSIPVAFAVYAWAFAIWTLIPLFIVMVTRIRRRRVARAGSST